MTKLKLCSYSMFRIIHFLNKFINFCLFVKRNIRCCESGKNWSSDAECIQFSWTRLEPRSFFRRSSSAEEPVSAGWAGATGAAAAARNAGVSRDPAGSDESDVASAALASDPPPRAPRRPARPPLLPPSSPSRGSSSAAGSGSAAGYYYAYACANKAFNYPRSGYLAAGFGAGFGAGAGTAAGNAGTGELRSTTLVRVLMAFSRTGSTWCSIPNLCSKS